MSCHVYRRSDWTLHWIMNYYIDVNLSKTMQRETTQHVLYEIRHISVSPHKLTDTKEDNLAVPKIVQYV